jgi:hypothetical protein
MTIVRPILKITHFADLQHGDFFIYEHAHGRSVALKVRDPRMDYPDLALPLGPDFPAGRAGPHLYQAPHATVISLARTFLFDCRLSRGDGRQAHHLCLVAASSLSVAQARVARRRAIFEPIASKSRTLLVSAISMFPMARYLRPALASGWPSRSRPARWRLLQNGNCSRAKMSLGSFSTTNGNRNA